MAATQAKTTKPKKTTPPAHPTYLQMIEEAIKALKERNGSSTVAIAKFLEDKYKSKLPSNFRKMLSFHLRRLLKSEKLVKVKNSYKVPAAQKKAPTSAAAAKAKPSGRPTKKPAEAAKTKKAAPAKAKVVKKKPAAAGTATKKAAGAAPKKAAGAATKKATGAAAKKKVAKPAAGKKRTVKSIKSPKKAPAAKRAKV